MAQAEQVGQQADLSEFSEKTCAARDFAEYWRGRGDEKQGTQRYWIGLLGDVMGISNATNYIEFEKPVKLKHTSFIDGYISSTKVLIEQKGSKIDLTKAYPQSDGATLTPYGQAKRHADELPYDLRPRWIVVCNFHQIHVHDMNSPHSQPEAILLENLEKELYRLQFLVDERNEQTRREEEVSLQAGILVGRLYDALIKQYINPDESSLRSLNILCVRLVFCFYAEDAGLFETRTSFEDYIKSFNLPNLRKALIDLFRGLDTELENRDKYDTSLKSFPYVNGGLFAAEDIEVPNFTQEIVDVLVNHCAPFNWAEISPTIFGSVFESTLNPETRRTGGMHYTSIENIHRVIDPLFLDELEAEFNEICTTKAAKAKSDKLHAFQGKLGSMKFLDPACGSGNFLTETYLSLRRLENRVISILNRGEKVLGFDEFIKVGISQFHGIETNDFAVTVAKTALWIAESQMMAETERIVGVGLDFLPLSTGALIVEGNALRMDWATLKPIDETVQLNDGLFAGFATEVDGSEIKYDYIMGNPPFVGKSYQTKEQKDDMAFVFDGIKNFGNLDFVTCWYKKACDYIQKTDIKCAFVSTNSICQGIAVPPLWNYLFASNIEIDFAYRTFKWNSESTDKAAVHCVIIGFSCHTDSILLTQNQQKKIYNVDGSQEFVKNINAYLMDAPNIIVDNRSKPLSDVPEMIVGSCPTDGGGFILTPEEYEDFIKKEPNAKKYIKKYIGSEEFINNKIRYCLWLKDCPPNELTKMPLVMKHIKSVQEFRLASKKEQTRKRASSPTLFAEDRYIPAKSIIIPMLSSENRDYVPMGFIDENTVPSNLASFIANATLYIFGVITSKLSMEWMKTVGSRMKSDYRFSASLVYNTFPFPNPTEEQKAKIEQTAQAILDARSQFPEASLADLYNPLTMPPALRKAHQENDKAVEKAYGKTFSSDDERVAFLFEKYVELTEGR